MCVCVCEMSGQSCVCMWGGGVRERVHVDEWVVACVCGWEVGG